MPPDSILSDRTTEPASALPDRVPFDLGRGYNSASRKTPGPHLPARWIHPMRTSEDQTPTTLKLRAFIDAVLAIAWSALPDGSLDFINQRFRDYTGLSSDQLTGWEWKSVVHPDDIEKLGTWWQDVRQSQEAGTTEKRLRRFDGAYRWFRIAAAPVHDEQANLVRWCGINTDIDDLKCSEQKFRQEATDLRTITDAIRQSIVVLAPDGTMLYANRVVREVTGLTIREVATRASLPESIIRTT